NRSRCGEQCAREHGDQRLRLPLDRVARGVRRGLVRARGFCFSPRTAPLRECQLMSEPLAQLEETLGHRFRDRGLLVRAVTHPSYLPEHPETEESNQRLEFLGDAVLQLVLTEALFDLYPLERE